MLEKILEILEKDSRTTNEQIAIMLGIKTGEVETAIKELENNNVILKYRTLINWEKTNKEVVIALIEVKVTPQNGEGFEKIAERIYKFNEVKACYLMSGGFDLTVIVQGNSMKEVALFVAEKLSPQECVLSTSTHFILKKYKDEDTVFDKTAEDDREAIIL